MRYAILFGVLTALAAGMVTCAGCATPQTAPPVQAPVPQPVVQPALAPVIVQPVAPPVQPPAVIVRPWPWQPYYPPPPYRPWWRYPYPVPAPSPHYPHH